MPTDTDTDNATDTGTDHATEVSTRKPRRLHSVTPVVAALGVVVALAGLVWGTRPLETPTQDCGTAFSFLVEGRVDEFVDPQNPPAGVTPADAEANNSDPCQERAADRSRPAGAMVVGGTVLAAGAAAVDLGVRGWNRRPRPR